MTDENDDAHWMRSALEQARLALDAGEVPVGCVIVLNGRLIGRGWNRTESACDPTAHAEILAISAACGTVGYERLSGATAYVTVEPCLMCAGALLLARVDEVVYGAPEPKFGGLGSRVDLRDVPGMNHRYFVRSGVLADEASSMLRAFFRLKRKKVEGAGSGEIL